MSATISQQDLVRAMQVVSPMLGRGHQPLAAVRLESRGDELVVSATNGEATARHIAPLDSPGIGAAIVPARPLQRFAASVTGSVRLELDRDLLVASADKIRIELRTVTPDSWVTPAEPVGEAFTLGVDDVARIRRVQHAAAPAAAHPTLAALRLEPGWAVALDGYRLAAARISVDAPECVIPIEVAAAALEDQRSVEVVSDARLVMLSTESTTYVSTTVAGTYPDWRQPLPAAGSRSHRLAAPRRDLLRATRRAESLGFNAAGTSFTKIEMMPSSSTSITVRSVDTSLGESDEEVNGVLTLPQIAFNARYLRQAIEQATGDLVELELDEGTKPALLHQGDVIQLVMPIRR